LAAKSTSQWNYRQLLSYLCLAANVSAIKYAKVIKPLSGLTYESRQSGFFIVGAANQCYKEPRKLPPVTG